MGIDDEVPVGFEDIRLDVSVDGDLTPDTRAALRKYTERYCVVYRTLEDLPEVETTWTFPRGIVEPRRETGSLDGYAPRIRHAPPVTGVRTGGLSAR